MLCGAHESVAGALHLAFERARKDGCRAVQIFTKSSGMWREPSLSREQVSLFREARARFAGPVLAHTSYLINLATDKPDILQKSVDALEAEVVRSSELGVTYVVLHPGAHLGYGEDSALWRVAEGLDHVLARTKGAPARILLENTAGQGTCVGHSFDHLAAILERTGEGSRLGVCFDTQHAYAAGYDLSTAAGYTRTWADFAQKVGLERICAFHLNDSKKALGSRVDRHEHIGDGELGLPLFWRLVNDPRFASVPGVIETEPEEGAEAPYAREVARLKALEGAPEPAAKPAFALELWPGR